MPEEKLNRREPIHINCPYCGADFINFKQIGDRIRIQGKTYDHFEVLPIIESEPYRFRNYLRVFCKNFTTQKVQCSACKRPYLIELFPFDRVHDYSQSTYRNYNDRDDIVIEDYSLLERNNLVSKNNRVVNTLLDHYKRLLPYYVIPLIVIVIGFLVNNEQLIGIFPYYITIYFFMGFLLSLYKCQNNHFKQLNTFDKLPFLIHDNYKKSYSFSIFQNKIIDRLGIYKKPDHWIQSFVMLLMGILLAPIMSSLQMDHIWNNNILTQVLLFLVLVILGTGLYIYYLIFAVIGSSLTDIFFRLQFVFKNIPLKLDPWDNNYGIHDITTIWSSAIITYIVISWVFPAILTYRTTSEFLFQLIVATDKGSIIQDLFSNYIFITLIIVNLCVISAFLYSIYLLRNNIETRKNEMKLAIKERIEKISKQEAVTNQELSQVSFMKLEYEQIEKIPSIPIPYSIVLTIIYALINATIIIYGLFF